ncbi:hypothetical protein GCM10008904_14840 [Paraclostridium ghonii]|uniref:Uncharacterized protein n=1 Tax=Paraclostridium ghonii TaxID=29358 RepID=A0ABU0MZR9_9FIRM|nr:hypothetical protein [Paeniclostridium ghonii]
MFIFETESISELNYITIKLKTILTIFINMVFVYFNGVCE